MCTFNLLLSLVTQTSIYNTFFKGNVLVTCLACFSRCLNSITIRGGLNIYIGSSKLGDDEAVDANGR